MNRLRHYLEMIRFSHTLFALPFALLSALMAWRLQAKAASVPNTAIAIGHELMHAASLFGIGPPVAQVTPDQLPNANAAPLIHSFHWQDFFGILLCMVFARSAAMAFNRLVDRDLDAENPRTQQRHLPAGLLSVNQVRFFALVSAAGFIASTLLFFPNRLPFYLSVPVLLFLCGYSYAKRFTALAHFWLGAALMLAPIAAWIAIRGQIVQGQPLDLLPAVLLGGAVLLWVSGFDMIYACQDYEFDKARGLRSVPVLLGVRGALRAAALCHLGTLTLLFALPSVYPDFSWIYYAGVGIVAALLVYEHALVRPEDLSRVNRAFFQVNAVISLGLLLVGCIDLWWRG